MSVLIVGGQSRAALAMVQSLGRKKIPIDVVDWHPNALTFASRYVNRKLTCSSPYVDKDQFIRNIATIVHKADYELLIPTVDEAFIPISENREIFLGNTHLILSSPDAVDITFDKLKTAQFSEKMGIKTPKTLGIQKELNIKNIREEIGFPAVIKPRKSVLWEGGRGIRYSAEYAFSEEDLKFLLLERQASIENHILQEYVEGKTVGFGSLSKKGQVLLRFQYERLRDSNPKGSGSSLRRSMEIDSALQKIVDQIIHQLEWSGLIMFEFRRTTEEEYFLIEINGRPWGSIQLAISSGVDFPYWLYRSLNEDIEPPRSYRVPLLSRWLVGDLWHLYYVLSGPPGGWKLPYPSRIKTVLSFICPNRSPVRYDFFCLDDPKPFYREISEWVGIMFKKVNSKFLNNIKSSKLKFFK